MTVYELIKALQRALIYDDLSENSEVLNANLEEAHVTINTIERHVVIE